MYFDETKEVLCDPESHIEIPLSVLSESEYPAHLHSQIVRYLQRKDYQLCVSLTTTGSRSTVLGAHSDIGGLLQHNNPLPPPPRQTFINQLLVYVLIN